VHSSQFYSDKRVFNLILKTCANVIRITDLKEDFISIIGSSTKTASVSVRVQEKDVYLHPDLEFWTYTHW